MGIAIAIGTERLGWLLRSVFANARMVVIEDVDAFVVWVMGTGDACITGTEIAVGLIRGNILIITINSLPNPGTILAMGGNDDPLFTEWMPTFLPFCRLRNACCVHDESFVVKKESFATPEDSWRDLFTR
jgi:hypothetical protein